MSWLWNPSGNAPNPQPAEEKVPDPGDPSRMVTRKAANQPFLAYHEYKLKQEKLHQAWLQRKKEREEKLARGEPVGPEEQDPTAEEEVGLLGLLKFIVCLLLIITLAGKFFTGSFLWEYDGKWARLRTYWPHPSNRLFSESLLATFDGTDINKPVYIAVGTPTFSSDWYGTCSSKRWPGRPKKIDGEVYDVSGGRRTYGPGGPYHTMAGIDAARSFATGCFATHRTHDLRGLSEQELRGVEHWKNFFANHKTYFKVGRVLHPPVDPLSPIPEHCNPKKEEPERPRRSYDRDGAKPWDQTGPNGGAVHQEL